MPQPKDIVAMMLAGIILLFVVLSAWITLAGFIIDAQAVLMWKDVVLTTIGGLVGYISGSSGNKS